MDIIEETKREINLQELIKKDKEERLVAFSNYIEAGKKKFNCTLGPKITITNGGIACDLIVEAL